MPAEFFTDLIYGTDDTMHSCRIRASKIYQADSTLSHEHVAYHLGEFIWARLMEQPATAERDALLSLLRHWTKTATYLSCGRKAIISAIASMLRLALPYASHPDYRQEWKP